MLTITEAGIPMATVGPMPPDPAMDVTFSGALLAGAPDATVALSNVAALIDAGVAQGKTAFAVTRNGDVSWQLSTGPDVMFSARIPAVPIPPDAASIADALADAQRAFDRIDEERDTALTRAEEAYDGKALMRAQQEIGTRWLEGTHAAVAVVSALAHALEKASAMPANDLRPEDVATAEFLSWAAKNLPPQEFFAQAEGWLNAGKHAALIGGFLRKQAEHLPPWWQNSTNRLTDLLGHPAIVDGGPYGRQQAAQRTARTARAQMFTRLAKVSATPRRTR
jgi:hypothetical protein